MKQIRLEELITLNEATKLLPRRRGQKRVHVSTLHRWASVGLRGVRLATVSVGGCRCTSRQHLSEFFGKLTQMQTRSAQPVSADDPVVDAGVEEELKARGM